MSLTSDLIKQTVEANMQAFIRLVPQVESEDEVLRLYKALLELFKSASSEEAIKLLEPVLSPSIRTLFKDSMEHFFEMHSITLMQALTEDMQAHIQETLKSVIHKGIILLAPNLPHLYMHLFSKCFPKLELHLVTSRENFHEYTIYADAFDLPYPSSLYTSLAKVPTELRQTFPTFVSMFQTVEADNKGVVLAPMGHQLLGEQTPKGTPSLMFHSPMPIPLAYGAFKPEEAPASE